MSWAPGYAWRGRIIENLHEVEHHRWFPPDSGTARGLAPLDHDTRELLHRMRWRRPMRDPRRLWGALALTLLLHVLLLALIVHELRPQRLPPTVGTQDDALQVRLITGTPVPPAAAAPAMPALPRPVPRQTMHARPPVPPRAVREPLDRHAMTISLPTKAPPPKLYDATGQIRLPPAPATSARVPAYVSAALQGGDSAVMKHDAGNRYRPTQNRFTQYFPPPGESSVDTAIRKAVEKTTKTATIHLPKGVRFHCSTVLFILPAGCGGDPPPPPPPTDGDERLSMAPAPLVKHPPGPKPPSVAKCIAIYRAGKPLPYGCPVDTPYRAVDAQLRELHRKQAGGQKGH
ncbi:hypothetical protein [Dyella sp. A6]|uniref:hypothetical protein n=1 Tax=Dyella aluminiiresistens TaxID=3069105 RepID=UPI002E771D2C|nr:hypothetical protein [Dyella sp. A6]